MIVDLALAILIILAAFLLHAIAFTAIGLLVRRWFGLRGISIDDAFLAFWTGFGIVVLILIVWNFFLPIGWPSWLFVLGLGGAALLWNRKDILSSIGAIDWRPGKVQVVCLLAGSLWVANQSMAGFRSWDGALYHLQAVQWAKSYPVVPGVGNLHGPLAFNNSSFLYDAMLDSGWMAGRGFHIANGILLFMMVAQAIVAGGRFLSSRQGGSQLYRFLLLAPALYLVHDGDLASYSTDVPMTLVLLTAGALLFSELSGEDGERSSAEGAYRLTVLAILLATAVCIKMTSAAFATVAMCVAVVFWWRKWAGSGFHWRGGLAYAVIAAFTFAALWMARGVILSGYPFFPLTVAGFHTDWRVPVEHAQAELANAAFTEREFSWRVLNPNWLRHIFVGDPYAALVPAVLAAVALLGFFSAKEVRRNARTAYCAAWWLLLPALVALAVWLMSVPSTRYSSVFFWTLAAVCVCECWRVRWAQPQTTTRWPAFALIAISVSPPIVDPALRALRQHSDPITEVVRYNEPDSFITEVVRYNFIEPDSERVLTPVPDPPAFTVYTTRSGLSVHVPLKPAAGSEVGAPWNIPLPTTPNPAANLELRAPGRLEKGFRVSGAWQMRDWPYYWRPAFLSQWRDHFR